MAVPEKKVRPPGAAKVSLGHLALHYGAMEDGPKAARLLQELGFAQAQAFPLPDGSLFYQFYVDPYGANNGDGIVYLSKAPAPIAALTQQIRTALHVGAVDEHASVAAFRAGQAHDPEMCFHLGLLIDSLERIEEIVQRARVLNETDPDLKGRLKVTLNAAQPGDPAIDARMAASPVFAGVTRHPYGRNAIQAFIETDLLMAGPLGESMVIELDFVFPGYPNNLFTTTEV